MEKTLLQVYPTGTPAFKKEDVPHHFRSGKASAERKDCEGVIQEAYHLNILLEESLK